MARPRRFRLPIFLLRRDGLYLAGALALLALAGAYLYWSRPTPLTVAVGPRDSADARLMEAYAALLDKERRGIRLALTYQDDVRDAAAALQDKRADLAVVRPDVRVPENGLTLAVLRDEALVVVAPESAGIDGLAALAGRRLGLVARHQADGAFIANLLRYEDLSAVDPGGRPAPNQVGLATIRSEDVAAALSERRVDAVAVVAAPASPEAAAVVRAVEGAARDRKVAFAEVPEGEAIGQRFPQIAAVTIPAGAFGGRPRWPAEDMKSVGISYRLMARDDLKRETAAAVTQYLFEKRGRLSAAAPSAHLLKAPDFDSAITATSARLPNHPGAVDYFQREQLTFFQAYGDWVYLALFGGGSVGSALAWLGQRLRRKRRALVDVVLDRLMDILAEARESRDPAALDALAMEIDSLVLHAVRYARHRTTDTRTMSALILAIDSARSAVADRRRALVVGRDGIGDGAGDGSLGEAARCAALELRAAG
jgi:TRAP-type uncharacterized transport system substrate-binding protein